METQKKTTGTLSPPMSKTAYVVARLREEIGSGEISPGTPLLQNEIATRYGVSPTPVREALRVLEADGIVEYSAYYGATVREITPQEIDEYYRLRAEVEGLATEIAVERMTDDHMEKIETIHSRIGQLVQSGEMDDDSLTSMNRSLHFAIYSAGSEVITSQIKSLWTFIPPRITLWRDPAVASLLMEDHERIMAALRGRDAQAARSFLTAHVLRASQLRREAEAASSAAMPDSGDLTPTWSLPDPDAW